MTAVKVWNGSTWVNSGITEKVYINGAWVTFSPGAAGPESIFGTETPTNVAEDGVALTQGTRFTPAVNGTVSAGKWWCGVSPPTSAKAAIYRVSDTTQLAVATFGTLSALAWNTVNFSSPVSLVAGTQYAAVCWTQNRYPYTASYPFPKVSGNLTASGCYFSVSADIAYPTSSTSLSFFCDMVFTAS